MAKAKEKAIGCTCGNINKPVFVLSTEENIRVFDLRSAKVLASIAVEKRYGLAAKQSAPAMENGLLIYAANGIHVVDLNGEETHLGSSTYDFVHLVKSDGSHKDILVSSRHDTIYTFSSDKTDQKYSGVKLHTSMGDITIRFSKLAPKTTQNFIDLCSRKYYNNVIFHRVIKGFMIQTGDPDGNGTGGESASGGYFEDEFHPLLNHDKPFMVSMANSGPNTNGSQFFITTASAPHLNNKHTVFGEVVDGFEVVGGIEGVETEGEVPREMVVILGTTLIK